MARINPDPSADNPDGDQQDPPDRPEWLDDQFATGEELQKAYRESVQAMNAAQREAADSRQGMQQIAERMTELEQRAQQQPQPGQAYDPQTDPFLLASAQAFEEGDYLRAEQLRDRRTAMLLEAAFAQWGGQQNQPDPEQVAAQQQIFSALAERAVADKFGDEWLGLREEVSEILHKNPHFVPNTQDPFKAAEAISFVAASVRDRRLTEQGALLGNQQIAEALRQKQLAQTEMGGSGRLPQQENPADALLKRFKQFQGSGY